MPNQIVRTTHEHIDPLKLSGWPGVDDVDATVYPSADSMILVGPITSTNSADQKGDIMPADQQKATLTDPVILTYCLNNDDARMLAWHLDEAGVPAWAIEDNSPAGLSALGPVSGIHRPYVYVDRHELARAKELQLEYEAQARARAEETTFCYRCGASQPKNQTTCSECGATIDADEDDDDSPEPSVSSDVNSFMRNGKFWIVMLVFLPMLFAVITGIVLSLMSFLV